jgi:hypothetical protein
MKRLLFFDDVSAINKLKKPGANSNIDNATPTGNKSTIFQD